MICEWKDRDGCQRFGGVRVPDTDGAIERAGQHNIAGWVQHDSSDLLGMALEGRQDALLSVIVNDCVLINTTSGNNIVVNRVKVKCGDAGMACAVQTAVCRFLRI